MIKRTFCHIDGVSQTTEELLWQEGINEWDLFLDKSSSLHFLPHSKIERMRTEIILSQEALKENNLRYFREKLIEKEHWRLLDLGKVAYVDIETTGLSRWTDEITMIGIYDGEESHIYIKDQNLEEAKEKLKEFDIVVTFNGKRFDMPFIEHKFKEKYDIIHLDLCYMLKEFGLKGGLKKIEYELGISRDDEIANVDGFEAVRLWRKYKKGDEEALRLLKKYNKEDIENLKTLLKWYINKKIN